MSFGHSRALFPSGFPTETLYTFIYSPVHFQTLLWNKVSWNTRGNRTCNASINVIMRRFRLTIFPWKSNKYYIFWVCVCYLSYLACNAQAPRYCYLWPVRVYHIFPQFLINGTIFREKVTEHTARVLIPSTTFCPKQFPLLEELSETWSWMYRRLHAKYSLFLSDFD